jgi:hypothetical protein
VIENTSKSKRPFTAFPKTPIRFHSSQSKSPARGRAFPASVSIIAVSSKFHAKDFRLYLIRHQRVAVRGPAKGLTPIYWCCGDWDGGGAGVPCCWPLF